MTKQEAIEAMQRGEKVTHRYFTSEEWVTLEGNHVKFEDGVRMPEKEFWSIRRTPTWGTDWSIFTAATTS